MAINNKSKQIEDAFLMTTEEAIEQGNLDCSQCGGRGWITVDSGAGDEFTQFESRCDKCNLKVDDDSDMSGAD